MKRLFMTFAAMLLMSVGAFAQSSETPLKGDMNEDGVVDVSDITAVIGIIKNVQEHYFYLGTVKPTAENYKIIPGTTTSYTSFDETAGTTISVDAGQTVYMLCPAEWVKGKAVTLEDNSGETVNFSEEIDYTTVSGYAIYKTQVLTDAKDVTLKGSAGSTTYTWYKGLATEDQIQNQSYINGLSLNQTTKPTDTITMNTGYNVMLFPTSWNMPTLYEDSAHTFEAGIYTAHDLNISNPAGYNVIVYELYEHELPESITLYIQW